MAPSDFELSHKEIKNHPSYFLYYVSLSSEKQPQALQRICTYWKAVSLRMRLTLSYGATTTRSNSPVPSELPTSCAAPRGSSKQRMRSCGWCGNGLAEPQREQDAAAFKVARPGQNVSLSAKETITSNVGSGAETALSPAQAIDSLGQSFAAPELVPRAASRRRCSRKIKAAE